MTFFRSAWIDDPFKWKHVVGRSACRGDGSRRALAGADRSRLGPRFPKGLCKLAGRVREALADHPELCPASEPLLSLAAASKGRIGRLDKAVMARTKDNPACRLPMTVPGVGSVTTMAYAAMQAVFWLAWRMRLGAVACPASRCSKSHAASLHDAIACVVGEGQETS